MKKEELLQEYEATLNSLMEKTRLVYSSEFYKLDDFDKQKYTKDKMATEGHLSALCNLLWGDKAQLGGGLTDFFTMAMFSSILGGGFNNMPPLPKFEEIKEEHE